MKKRSWILITGASRGIGKASAMKLAQNTQYGLILVSRNLENLQQSKSDILNHHPNAMIEVISADLSTAENSQALAHQVQKQIKQPLHGLVLNSGHSNNSLFAQITPDQLTYELGVNYLAPLALIREFLPEMEKNRSGSIVATSTLTSMIPFPGNATYAASKSALLSFLRALKIELRSSGIKVGAVLPGLTKTEMTEKLETSLWAMKPERVATDVEKCLKQGGFFVPGFDNRLALNAFRVLSFSMDQYIGWVAPWVVPGFKQALSRKRK
jgi:short-subunit dehydrogenase